MSASSGKLRAAGFAAALFVAVCARGASFNLLYSFTGPDAAEAQSPLLIDTDGSLLGTSPYGGDGAVGSVFRLSPGAVQGSIQVLYSFQDQGDGSLPFAGLVSDSAGNLFGVASAGGDTKSGTVFELARSGSTYTFQRLYSFSGGADGTEPVGGLVIDESGNLFGTTSLGGSGGTGTVFELVAGSSGYSLTTLYSFSAASAGANADGALPQATLLRDRSGILYGTATAGGPSGNGVVFELTPGSAGYSFSVVHAFTGGEDQAAPVAGLVADSAGNLFGTTSGNAAAALWGTVFEISSVSRSPVFRTLYAFHDLNDGAFPYAPLLVDSSGNLIGTAGAAGESGAGTLFELTPSGSGYDFQILYAFAGEFDGAIPAGGVVADAAGRLYGTTFASGIFGWGTLFEFTPPPTALSRVVAVSPGSPAEVDLGAADPGLPGTTFTFTIASSPAHGTLSAILNGTTVYTPGNDFPGTDTFTYTATDANGTSNPATVTLMTFTPRKRVLPVAPPSPTRIDPGRP